MTDFGDELTHWMTVRQIGVRALARRSGYSTGFISQLCSGKRNPSSDTGQNLDDALAAGGRVAALVPRPLRRGATSSPNSPEAPRARNQLAEVAAIFSAAVDGLLPAGAFSEQEYGQLVQALSNWAMQMKRRDLLAILGAAATAAYASPLLERLNPDEAERLALAASQTHRADEAIIGHINAVLNHCMRQEDTLGPQVVLETVYAQRHLVRSLLPAATADPLRAQMLSLLANINRFTGWVLFNLNDFAGAQHYYTEARHVAHEADDDAMCSLVLANWSQLATWSGDPRLGVEHALGAVAWGQRAGSKLLVSYARDVGARAYSAVVRRSGKRNQRPDQGHCMESLDLAHRGLVDAPDGDPGSTLVYFYDDGIHLTTRIGCLLDLGDPAAALAATEQARAAADPSFPRNLAMLSLIEARVHARMRDVDAACKEIGEAAALARHNNSPRLVRAVLDARKQVSPWQQSPSVANLDERLRAYQITA